MIRILALGLLALPISAFADCRTSTAEPFKQFLESFANDKHFAIARTEYPLRYIRYEEPDVEQEGRTAIKSVVDRSTDLAQPTMAGYARDNDVELNTISLKKARAVVRIAKPHTDALIVDYHFGRKGACWYLRRIENQSLSD